MAEKPRSNIRRTAHWWSTPKSLGFPSRASWRMLLLLRGLCFHPRKLSNWPRRLNEEGRSRRRILRSMTCNGADRISEKDLIGAMPPWGALAERASRGFNLGTEIKPCLDRLKTRLPGGARIM